MTRWRRVLSSWGWAWPVGVAALLIAATLVELSSRWVADAAMSRDEARSLRVAMAASERARHDASTPSRLDLAGWPGAARGGERVADMLERALRQGLVVQSTQQRLDAIPEAPGQMIRLQQTAQGTYLDLRRYIGAALVEDAALGLDRVRLQRSSASDPNFEADLQWVLMQRTSMDPR